MEKIGLGTVNWVVLIVYLIAMLGVGFYFIKRSGKDTYAFFTACGTIPSWSAAFSRYARTLMTITVMTTPSEALLTDWSYSAGNRAILAIIAVWIFFYIPFFRTLMVTTACEYLEDPFGVSP